MWYTCTRSSQEMKDWSSQKRLSSISEKNKIETYTSINSSRPSRVTNGFVVLIVVGVVGTCSFVRYFFRFEALRRVGIFFFFFFTQMQFIIHLLAYPNLPFLQCLSYIGSFFRLTWTIYLQSYP